ncbi:hypothetical protein [Dyadobacter bucti]|uniref:hypothetical protein n=1 Tax=Dyadobacter bucti TaxID=2572203 RepID=UPI001108D8D3|nr:hypothetical protein [Dyadobacter bucti]
MKMYKNAFMVLIMALNVQAMEAVQRSSARQPYPDSGFWTTELLTEEKATIVRYYANSISLISETREPRILDITKLPVRKYLNKKLAEELSKDTTNATKIRLYEIR